MEFRRSGQLEDRRRRVLMDEIASPTETSETSTLSIEGAKGPVRAYAPAVLEERQLRTTDFIPRRPALVTIAILTLLTVVAAVETLHIVVATSPLSDPAGMLSALNLTARGNVGHWLSSLVLGASAACAMAIFSVRVHRVDDYRGRYRVWLWTAGALLLASIDSTAGLRDCFAYAMQSLVGWPPEGSGQLWWLMVYTAIAGTLAARLSIEMWPSLVSFSSLAIASLIYIAAALAAVGVYPASGPLLDSVIGSSLSMLAHATLLSTLLLFARHVCLDAEGRLMVSVQKEKKPRAKRKPKLTVVDGEEKAETKKPSRRAAASADEDDDADEKPAAEVKKPAATQPAAKPSAPLPGAKPAAAGSGPLSGLKFGASATPAKPAAISNAAASAASQDDDDEDDDADDEDGDRGMSRAERKRLKKLARRDQQRRAA